MEGVDEVTWKTITAPEGHTAEIAEIARVAQSVGPAYADMTAEAVTKFLRKRDDATILFYTDRDASLVFMLGRQGQTWRLFNVLPGGTYEPDALRKIGLRALRAYMDRRRIERMIIKTFVGQGVYSPEAEEFYLHYPDLLHECDHGAFREVKRTVPDPLHGGEAEEYELWTLVRRADRKSSDEAWQGRSDMEAIRAEVKARRDKRGRGRNSRRRRVR